MEIPQPHKLAEERLELAYQHSVQGQRLVEIKVEKARKWDEFKKEYKSDTATEKAWERTELGLEEMKLRASMKSKELRMSAIKTMIEVLNDEARNYY